MSATLTIQVSNAIHKLLQQESARQGKTPEILVAETVARSFTDPSLNLAQLPLKQQDAKSAEEDATALPLRWEGDVLVFDGVLESPCEDFIERLREERMQQVFSAGVNP